MRVRVMGGMGGGRAAQLGEEGGEDRFTVRQLLTNWSLTQLPSSQHAVQQPESTPVPGTVDSCPGGGGATATWRGSGERGSGASLHGAGGITCTQVNGEEEILKYCTFE